MGTRHVARGTRHVNYKAKSVVALGVDKIDGSFNLSRPMTLPVSRFVRFHWIGPELLWWVLLMFMVGMNFSSVGETSSHGLAAISMAMHVTAPTSGDSDEHLHQGEAIGVDQSEGGDHPHHAADHSHDKVHALPPAWGKSDFELPRGSGLVRSWRELIQASRLERPPMG